MVETVFTESDSHRSVFVKVGSFGDQARVRFAISLRNSESIFDGSNQDSVHVDKPEKISLDKADFSMQCDNKPKIGRVEFSRQVVGRPNVPIVKVDFLKIRSLQ